MNFLAHAWLSFNEPEILVGNMISDFVKGKKQFDFSNGIQKGIKLHRAIDTFTDAHKATAAIKEFFRPHYRLYSGALTDVVYDHFLANDKHEFSNEDDLKKFAAATYQTLDRYQGIAPLAFQNIYPYMKEHDWLSNYRDNWIIERSFLGIERRATFLQESGIAFQVFNEHKAAMREQYYLFFPELKAFTIHTFRELMNS